MMNRIAAAMKNRGIRAVINSILLQYPCGKLPMIAVGV
jgi:hypothetical protein